MNSPHILIISTTATPVSGWGVITHNYASALLAKGASFTLLLPYGADLPAESLRPFTMRILPDLPLSFYGPRSFIKAFRMLSHISYNPPPRSIVHSIVDFPYAALAYRYARLHHIPFYMNAIGTYSVAPFSNFFDRFLFMPAYRGAHRIFAISSYTKNAMIAAASRDRSVERIMLPVIRPVPAGREDFSIYNKLPVGKRYILTVTSPRSHGRKGFDDMRRAFDIVRLEIPDIHLVAVGGVAAASDSYTVFPKVTASELAALYSRSFLFAAMPFRTGNNFEGYGLVYREAGLYGKPVIGTHSGGVPEAVVDGVTGLLVPEHGIVEMASALRRLLLDESLAVRLGAAGFHEASLWTWGKYAAALSGLYANVF